MRLLNSLVVQDEEHLFVFERMLFAETISRDLPSYTEPEQTTALWTLNCWSPQITVRSECSPVLCELRRVSQEDVVGGLQSE